MADGDTRRRFYVEKDNGEQWWMLYTSRGVRWERQNPEPGRVSSHASGGDPSSPSETSALRSATSLMNAATGPIGAVACLIDSVATVLNWWEARQYRIIDQARFQEERRIPWTSDMMVRWVKAHEGGNHLDLRISSFLAREAMATMNALIADKKMAVPQALLYDLELIREVLSATRRLYGDQFDVIAGSSALDVSLALRGAVPNATLNHPFIRRLAEDPALDWSLRVRERASKTFDEDLREPTRHHDLFMKMLFTSSEIDRSDEPVAMDKGFLDSVASRVAFIPSLPAMISDQIRSDSTNRRDDYRELALFAAEANRVSALHTAWGVVDTAVRSQVGGGVLISELMARLG